MTLTLISTSTAITYLFRAAHDSLGWANCTVNDTTGELAIQSDWGSWSYGWNPKNLGAPTLTAFIAERGSVDYIARKLQNEGANGRRWSSQATAASLRCRLCERRLEDGRAQLEDRLEPDDLVNGEVPPRLSWRYDEHGLPLFSRLDPHRLPYLTRDTARRLWRAIGDLADEVDRKSDLFYERVQQIDDFADYVTGEPWHYGETEQTPQDKALREIVLPALIDACRAQIASTAGPAPKADAVDDNVSEP